MRKLFILFILEISAIYGLAQPLPARVYDNSGVMSISEGSWTKVKESVAANSRDIVTLIDGEEILGLPFLYWSWENGSISTASGRTISKYKLLYDVYHQTVLFMNGRDSMEVNEEIKEFSMVLHHGSPDTTESFRFINNNQFKGNKDKGIVYYQLLVDDEKGQLLKLNKKEIKVAENQLPASTLGTQAKMFVSQNEYYYYDKKKAIFTRLKNNGSNIPDVLGLTRERKNELRPNGYQFSQESELILFFKNSLATKAF